MAKPKKSKPASLHRGRKNSDPNKPRGMGRPFALTPLAFANAVAAVQIGANVEDAAVAAGIGLSTFHMYRSVGREQKSGLPAKLLREWLAAKTTEPPVLTRAQENQLCKDFADALRKAKSLMPVNHLQNIERAAMGQQVVEEKTIKHRDGTTETVRKFAPAQWTASAWKLERLRPKQFGRKDHTTHEVKGGEAGTARLVVLAGPEHIDPPEDKP